MCGIAGFFGGDPALHAVDVARRVLKHMGDAIARRGPDGDGYWQDPELGVAFAHRRLAIVDLSPSGAQPMVSASGRFVMVFNGEIYNHRKLREQLSGPWRGTSDTEVLLCGFDTWGIAATVQRSIGMFAFAIWDREERRLTLGRDRLGEKPLYYGWQGRPGQRRTLLFGSDLNALRSHPEFQASISRDALCSYMRYGNVSGEASIYEGIFKLPPGSLLSFRDDAAESAPVRFWQGEPMAIEAAQERAPVTPVQAIDSLELLLKDAIGQQMVADVPLGAFLSGGIDSSLVAALMQAQSRTPIQTYSIGFREDAYNEAHHAAAVARHLGTAHTEMYVTAQDALDIVPRLPSMYSEPFADSSQIPTHLLALLTRRHVTVALSGDGGDELFCGYNRYLFASREWRTLRRFPVAMRRSLARLMRAVPPSAWDQLLRSLSVVWPRSQRWTHFGDKVHKLSRVMASHDLDSLYLGLTSMWSDPGALVIGGVEPAPMTTAIFPALRALADVEQLMALDLVGYLGDDVLVKVDRAAMAASLETRAPYLDHRVVEFAWRLPQSLKLRDGQTKWVLRQVLYRHVPSALIERPKAGFGVPVGKWLRGPLRDWAEGLFDRGLLLRQGYLRPDPIIRSWQQHLAGHQQNDPQLWTVLMFQAWLQAMDSQPQPLET